MTLREEALAKRLRVEQSRSDELRRKNAYLELVNSELRVELAAADGLVGHAMDALTEAGRSLPHGGARD